MAQIYGLRANDCDQYFYIGSTRYTAEQRLAAHLDAVRNGRKKNRHFANKVHQIGADNVIVDVLEIVPDEQQYEREAEWIKRLLDDGVKLVNRIHNDLMPPDPPEEIAGFKPKDLVYALLWYSEYQQLGPREAKRPKDAELMLKLQETLAALVETVLTNHLDEALEVLNRAGISVQINQ